MKYLLPLWLILWALPAMAQVNGLLIAPTQLVFTPSQTAQSMSVANRSAAPMRLSVYLSDEVMTPAGAVATLAEGFPYTARKLVRFMPESIELAPGQYQTIRVLVRRPADLASGDYHSHLMIEQLPVSATTTTSGTPRGVKFGVTTLVTFGMPVIVQHGTISSSLTLQGLAPWPRMQPDGHNIAPFRVNLTRSGNATGVGFLTLKTPTGADLITPRRVSVYREVEAVTLSGTPTPLAATYKGPATLTLHAAPSIKAPVVKALNVTLP
jgi:hypothetical protein